MDAMAKIRERLRRYLAIARDSAAAPAEVEQAQKLAARLIRLYGLSEDGVAQQEVDEPVAIDSRDPWTLRIAAALAQWLGCAVGIPRDRTDSRIVFRGESHLASVAAYLCGQLIAETNREAERQSRRGIRLPGEQDRAKQLFCDAAAAGIVERMFPTEIPWHLRRPAGYGDELIDRGVLQMAGRPVFQRPYFDPCGELRRAPPFDDREMYDVSDGIRYGHGAALRTDGITENERQKRLA